MEYFDFHSHIRCELDDGARTCEESVSMLRCAYRSGAKSVLFTPHYHGNISVEDFLTRRDARICALHRQTAGENEIPAFYAAAEVSLKSGLSANDAISKLCVSGTEYLLLEMPFAHWDPWHYQEVHRLVVMQGIIPVIAHVDRYIKHSKDFTKIDKLLSIGAKFQVNAEAFLHPFLQRNVYTLMEHNLVFAIGSDCHNMTVRTPDIRKPLRKAMKKIGEGWFERLYEQNQTDFACAKTV